MTIFNQGSVNPAAAGVPGLTVNVVAPPAANLSGAPANLLGVVGSASWGPLNSPAVFSDEAGGAAIFGAMKNRKYDLMTQIHNAAMQGANNFIGVRVGDGTEAAATATVQTSGGTATAKYTGTGGNAITITFAQGTAPATRKVTITMPGATPEVFDNIPGLLNAAWVAMAAAINNGQTGVRGPSQLIVFSAGASVTTPVDGSATLTGGLDGATSVASANLIGVDTTTRTGMYALRNTGIAAFILADNDTSTSWTTQQAFAISECAFAYATGPASDTISNFKTTIDTAAIDNPWIKVLFGDWVYMFDGVNNIERLVSPQGFLAGNKMAIGPEQTSLNKPLNGVLGTQKSYNKQVYSQAELQLISAARGDVIVMNPPGGNYPAAAFGRNSSSDLSRRQETYTTMTNYLARSFDSAAGLGRFIGRLITPEQMREAEATIGGFLQNEWDAGRIGNAQGTIPYSVQVDAANNPSNVVNQGLQFAKVQVQYLNILEYFVLSFSGGGTVQIGSQLDLAA